MKRMIMSVMTKMMVVAFAAIVITGCSSNQPDAGFEGVWIKKPVLFGHGGVDSEPVSTGREWGAITSDAIYVDIRPIKINETFNDLATKDKTPIDFNVYLTIRVKQGEAPTLISKFGQGWYVNNLKEPFRTLVRNYARQKSVTEMMVDPAIITDMENSLYQGSSKMMTKIGLPVSLVRITVGKVNPPAEVLTEAAETARQKQAEKTQNMRKIAEDARKAAEIAKANADLSYMRTFKGMTVADYLRLRGLEIQKEMLPILKGNQNVHVNLIMGNGSKAAVPVIRTN